jgi:RimJ/RimL family protein N-acetyltransferase
VPIHVEHGLRHRGIARPDQHGFADLGVERVFGHSMTVNTASRRVMEKCGLTLVRTTTYDGPDIIEGSGHGEVEYALTRPEWEALTARDVL